MSKLNKTTKSPLICRIFGHRYVNCIVTKVRNIPREEIGYSDVSEISEFKLSCPMCSRCGVKML